MGVKRYDLVVIGGGISGLSLAHYSAKAGLKTLLIEREQEAGGCLRTMRSPEGFWLELGAHTCYNSYGNLIGIIEDRGVLSSLQSRQKVPFMMLIDGKVRSIASQLDFIELFFSAPRLFTLSKSGMTVGSYYSKIVGKRNYQKVIGPALSAVPSQRVDDFPADMLFKSRKRRKDVIKKFTLRGGLQSIAEAVVKSNNIEFISGAEVRSIGSGDNSFCVSAEGHGECMSDSIGIAVPPSNASELLKDIAPSVAQSLSSIRTTRIESTGVVVRKGTVSLPQFAGLIPAEDIFFSVVSRDIVPDERYRGFTFHFRPGLGKADKLKKISQVLGTDKFEGVSENSAVLPSPVLGHDQIVKDIDRMLDGRDIYLTGNYFSGLAIEDCVTRSLTEFARLMNKQGGRPGI